MPDRFARAVCLVAAAGLVVLMAVRRTSDWDAYMHLAIGRAALLGGDFRLVRDPFSFAGAGTTAWRYKDLIADLIFYGGFVRLGYLWFALLKGAVVAAMAAALWLAPARQGRSPVAWLLALGALLAAVAHRVAERPQLFSLAALLALLALLERRRRDLATGARLGLRSWAAPVALVWAWAQLHREAMVGLVLLGGFAGYLTLARLLPAGPWWRARPSTRAVVAAWVATVAALAASALNVNGVRLWTSSVGLATSPLYRQMISEWEGLGPRALLAQYPAAALLALSAGVGLMARAALAVRARRRPAPNANAPASTNANAGVDAWHAGAWLLFALLTRSTLRWLPTLAALSALIDLLLLCELAAAWRAPRPRGATLLAAVAALALVAVAHPQPLGLGERRDRFPAGALAFAHAHGLHARVVNAYPFGGYVVWTSWPALRVVVDGRADTVYRPDYLWDALVAERDRARFAAMRAADAADWVLALDKPGDETHLFLADDPAWRLVYWSEAALVWVRADAYPELAPLVLRWVPHLMRLPADAVAAALAPVAHDATLRAEVERELLRMTAASPDGLRANALLALFYDCMGPAYRAARDRVLAHLAEVAGGHPALADALGR